MFNPSYDTTARRRRDDTERRFFQIVTIAGAKDGVAGGFPFLLLPVVAQEMLVAPTMGVEDNPRLSLAHGVNRFRFLRNDR